MINHIEIKETSDCCGCSACQQRCPVDCISLIKDSKGFLYPLVDPEKCIDCGMCIKVCPIVNKSSENIPIRSIGVIRDNSALIEKSSSAGIFYLISLNIINQGGVVFGARYNEDFTGVHHSYSTTIEGLQNFQGSKYLQSDLRNSFKECKDFLLRGRMVLFSGTPCQIAGLKTYLGREYTNLLTIELICHGVPSPQIWSDYVSKYIMPSLPPKARIINVDFRDRRLGWKDFGLTFKYQTDNGMESDTFTHYSKDLYYIGFYGDLFIRDVCYKCPIKLGRSKADITLGDLGRIQRLRTELKNRNLLAVILANTDKGITQIDNIKFDSFDISFAEVLNANPDLYSLKILPNQSPIFWEKYSREGIQCLQSIIKHSAPSRLNTIINCIKQIVYLTLHLDRK